MASEYTDEKTIIPKYATKLIVSIEPTELIVASASIAFILSGTRVPRLKWTGHFTATTNVGSRIMRNSLGLFQASQMFPQQSRQSWGSEHHFQWLSLLQFESGLTKWKADWQRR